MNNTVQQRATETLETLKETWEQIAQIMETATNETDPDQQQDLFDLYWITKENFFQSFLQVTPMFYGDKSLAQVEILITCGGPSVIAYITENATTVRVQWSSDTAKAKGYISGLFQELADTFEGTI